MGACTFQHEVDHLYGILFVDKIQPKQIAFIEEWEKFQLNQKKKNFE